MGDRSQIEWTDATWNPTRGCSKVSEGCRNCYAMRQAIRQSGPGGAYEGLVRSVPGKGPQWTGAIRLVEEALELPLRWRTPRRVFIDSMSDLFHADVPFDFIDRVFAVMACTPHHTYQILTKRPERAAAYFASGQQRRLAIYDARSRVGLLMLTSREKPDWPGWPLPNVWLGTSVEDQAAADERIPHLLRAPAAVRFLSCEPLLGPLRLWKLTKPDYVASRIGAEVYPLSGMYAIPDHDWDAPGKIDWVIAGGESGPGARPCDVGWLRSLRDQCRDDGVPFFLKQLGSKPDSIEDRLSYRGSPTKKPSVFYRHLNDRKGGDMAEWPEDLRIREFPEPAEAAHG